MLNTIKTYALAALGAIAAFGMFMWQMTRAKHEKALKDGIEKSRKTESKATDAMIEGLDNEAKIQADRSTNRDNFMD